MLSAVVESDRKTTFGGKSSGWMPRNINARQPRTLILCAHLSDCALELSEPLVKIRQVTDIGVSALLLETLLEGIALRAWRLVSPLREHKSKLAFEVKQPTWECVGINRYQALKLAATTPRHIDE